MNILGEETQKGEKRKQTRRYCIQQLFHCFSDSAAEIPRPGNAMTIHTKNHYLAKIPICMVW